MLPENSLRATSKVVRLLRSIYKASLCVVVAVAVTGCYALSNNSDTGPVRAVAGSLPIQSDKYDHRLEGTVSKERTVWRLGSLEGFCSVQAGNGVDNDLVVDDVLLASDALFDTSIHDISVAGDAILRQLKRRLAFYPNIKRIELVGHADLRGSASDNYTLALNRAESVRTWLLNNLERPVNTRVLSLGESKSHARDNVSELATDRRVDVRIISDGADTTNIDTTLCSLPGQAGPLATGTALQVAAVPSMTDQAKRNRLEAFEGDLPVSPGDQLQIRIAGDEDWNGIYEVSLGGGINIPLLGRQTVAGLTIPAIQAVISDQLVDRHLVRRSAVNVAAHVVEWAGVEVYVRGAVFNKGRVTVNAAIAENRALKSLRDGGDAGGGRLISAALRAAGGVRPDADLAGIQILRHGETIPVDLAGLVHGELVRDVPLISGDEVIVPSTGRFDHNLVTPTQVTPPGIRVYQSNATAPVFNNALSNNEKEEASVPYGTRVVQALTSMNCVGGAQSVNAARRTVLITKDYITGELSVTERSINRLLREPNRLDVNPYLMPGDALACYDSDVTNIRELALTLSDFFSPLSTLTSIFGQF